jgi:hypothetical protein
MKILRSNLFREALSVYTENGEEKELTLDEWRAIAGETWTPYITPQQPPMQRPPQPPRPTSPQQTAPAPASPPSPSPEETAPTDGDDGEVVAEGQPENTHQSRSKRKRKRKPKPRRPEGGPAPTNDSGE